MEIWTAYQAGFRTFLTGMARGVDVWARELILRLRSSHQDVHLVCALPHPDFEKKVGREWQERYYAIRQQDDYEVTICQTACRSACHFLLAGIQGKKLAPKFSYQ